MTQHHIIHDRPLKPQTERAILLFLRSLGAFALIVCILFWLSLLLR
jgi:hypothetical protein